MSLLLDKPERWRKQAEEARAIGASVRNPETRRVMEEIASSYEMLAERAQQQTRRRG